MSYDDIMCRIEELVGDLYHEGYENGWNRCASQATHDYADEWCDGFLTAWNTRADDYRHAAEYWQRMYENTFAERTCKIDCERHCSNCGVYVRDEAILVRKDLDDGAWTVVPKPVGYCPNCGAKVRYD